MEKRLELQNVLEDILNSSEVYFQPPESVKMHYPAIRYERDAIENRFADNEVYYQAIRYAITAMYYDPDDDLPIKLSQLPRCRHDRHYKADNLNHDVFIIYY
jgi:hypothetical protein